MLSGCWQITSLTGVALSLNYLPAFDQETLSILQGSPLQQNGRERRALGEEVNKGAGGSVCPNTIADVTVHHFPVLSNVKFYSWCHTLRAGVT